MAKMTSPERLDADIQEILVDYQNHVFKTADQVVERMAKKGKNAVRRNARAVITKTRRKYANGWQYKMDPKLRIGGMKLYWANQIRGATIYPGKQRGLAHLLEHGHAVVNGGRTTGQTHARPHVKPVEDQIANSIVSEVIRSL